MTQTLRLSLLDGFSFERAQRPVELPFAAQRLLSFLALHGPSPRSVVAGRLWPESPEVQAMASLRTSVWRTNKALPGVILASGHSLRIADGVEVDSRQQEGLARSLIQGPVPDVDWLCSQLPFLWPVELLPGWYDDWVAFERDRLGQLRLHALEVGATLLVAEGRLNPALALALEAIRSDPLRETASAVLISVHLAKGNVRDAIRQYQLFRELLGRELGVEPSHELARLLPRHHDTSAGQTRSTS